MELGLEYINKKIEKINNMIFTFLYILIILIYSKTYLLLLYLTMNLFTSSFNNIKSQIWWF